MLRGKILKHKNKLSVGIISTLSLVSTKVLANTGSGASTEVVAGISGIGTDVTATLKGVAPIGLGIIGVFLVWKYGVKFFKGLSK